jgi:hypothetical protein
VVLLDATAGGLLPSRHDISTAGRAARVKIREAPSLRGKS